VNGSVVVAGTVGGLVSVGLVGREGACRDATAVGAARIRGDQSPPGQMSSASHRLGGRVATSC